MFELPPGEHHRFGYDAYDVLISGLKLEDTEYQAKCDCAPYHIGSMQDARRAAYVYLGASAGLLEGENKNKLAEASMVFKQMLDNLLAAIPYEKTTPVFNSDVVGHEWDTLQRSGLIEALKQNKELEKQARIIIADILENWID